MHLRKHDNYVESWKTGKSLDVGALKPLVLPKQHIHRFTKCTSLHTCELSDYTASPVQVATGSPLPVYPFFASILCNPPPFANSSSFATLHHLQPYVCPSFATLHPTSGSACSHLHAVACTAVLTQNTKVSLGSVHPAVMCRSCK